METGLNAFKEALHLKHVEAGEYSPLALAYIGDAVYELAIRTLVMNRGNMQVNTHNLNKKNRNRHRPFRNLYFRLSTGLSCRMASHRPLFHL